MSPELKSIPVSLKYERCDIDSYDLVELVKFYHVQLGVTMDEIEEIQPRFVDVPGYVYTERGVAGPNHPLMGSIGVYIRLEADREAELQMILYHDRNPSRTHCSGLPHWNQEIRLINPLGKEMRITGDNVKVVKHVLPDTPYIDMHCLGPDGTVKRIITNRDDFRPNH